MAVSILKRKKFYTPVMAKFWISIAISSLWVIFSIIVARPWLYDLSEIIGFIPALFIITFVAFAPGFLVAFVSVSLLLDRQPKLRNKNPNDPITILIAARNEEERIEDTLKYIKKQNYRGKISVILVDNDSTDKTIEVARMAAKKLDLELSILKEKKKGKSNALNKGLKHIKTPLFITLDADTLLHDDAIKHIVARIKNSREDVCAVAGHVLVRNSRKNLLSKLQEWDYFLGITSIKKIQALYQGTLVAQGAFSLYKTDVVREVGGWPNAIGEDIVLTWNFFKNGYKVYFEPLAAAFTDVPQKLKQFVKQRSRWARGLFEGLRSAPPWKQPFYLISYLTAIDILIPIIDIVFTFVWIPGVILALFGKFYIAGPYTLLVIPLNFVFSIIMYYQQKETFRILNLTIRRNKIGYFMFLLFYQIIHSPVSVLGYSQEIFKSKRVWK